MNTGKNQQGALPNEPDGALGTSPTPAHLCWDDWESDTQPAHAAPAVAVPYEDEGGFGVTL